MRRKIVEKKAKITNADLQVFMKISKFFLHFFCKIFGQFNKTSYLCNRKSETTTAKIAQLVEHDLAKVGVAGSSPVFRSNYQEKSFHD